MPFKKTKFNLQWLDAAIHPQFSGWLSNVSNNEGQAYCNVCLKNFELSNMGKQAILSHASGPTHCKLLKQRSSQPSLTSFILKPQQSDEGNRNAESSVIGLTLNSAANEQSSEISSFMSKESVMKAEIIWLMEVVVKKHSLNSCSNISDIFKLMFPDSAIAAQFHVGSTKASYVINYGLAPYFNDSLLLCLKDCKDVTVCFDEALNKVAQKGQMDILVKYWDKNLGMVSTRYLTSVFLNRATADDLLERFLEGLSGIPLHKILHVSMDGPNVNLSFLNKLEEHISCVDPDGKKPVKFGTCGLHTVHGAVKTGLQNVGWDLLTFLRNLYYLFKDSPARRALYTAITGSTLFPKKCCAIRWLENVPCLERALEIFDDVKKYLHEGQVKKTNSKVSSSLKEAMKDPFLKCKLAFFKTVAAQCEPFLRRFQSPKPLAPFLYDDLFLLLKGLLKRFVKSSKLSTAEFSKLASLDLESAENLLLIKDINVGFGANKHLKEVKSSVKEKLTFQFECKNVLKGIIKKLIEKCPLKHKFVRGLSSLNPHLIITQPDLSQRRFHSILETLHDAKRIGESVSENAEEQFSSLVDRASNSFMGQFNDFLVRKNDEIGLDAFYSALLLREQEFCDLWEVIKLCLILSHGNASVESGFSVNQSLLVENLKEESLVHQRRVHDGIMSFGGIDKVPIDKKMLLSVRLARKRYGDDLQKKKTLASEENARKEEKRKLEKAVSELEERRKFLKIEKQKEESQIDLKIKLLEQKKKVL